MSVALLGRFVERHQAGDWAGLAELFGDRGELAFVGVERPGARGSAIRAWFEANPPTDRLLVCSVAPHGDRMAGAMYSWAAAPDAIAGSLVLTEAEGRIARMQVWTRQAGPIVPRIRTAVRALVLAEGRVLLFCVKEPTQGRRWWITPGGGIEAGEGDLQALRRECAEETGLQVDAIGRCVWAREHTTTWKDDVHRQVERFYVVRVPQIFEPRASVADEGTIEHRWFSIEELRASGESFAPRRLAEFLDRLIREGEPAEPLDVGI